MREGPYGTPLGGEDPARLVPLSATIGMLRLCASERTIAAADAVMVRIVATYYVPNVDFTARPSLQDGGPDMLRDVTEAWPRCAEGVTPPPA